MHAPTISAPRPFGCPATIDGLLNLLREKHGSDYAAAKAMGIRQQAISNYRSKRTLPDDVIALRIAKEVGLDPKAVLAMIAAERAAKMNNEEVAVTWREMAEKLGVLVLVIGGALLVTEPLFLDSGLIYAADCEQALALCIM